MAAVVAAAALSVTVIDATTVCSPAAIIALRVVGRGVTNICTTGVSVLVTVLVTVHAAALPTSPAVTITAGAALSDDAEVSIAMVLWSAARECQCTLGAVSRKVKWKIERIAFHVIAHRQTLDKPIFCFD